MPHGATDTETRRGRDATRVGEIPAPGWRDILWRTWDEFGTDHGLLVAAGVTFYALLAIVPALTALVSVYGLFADPEALNRHIDLLEGVVPGGALDVIREQLQRLTDQGRTRLGLTSAASIAIALWSANAGMKALFEAMNVAYDEEEKRGFLLRTALTLAFTLAVLAAILALVAGGVLLPAVFALVGYGAGAQWAVRIAGVAVAFLLMVGGLTALYRWGPSRRSAQWRWITPGAVLAMVVIVVTSAAFTWYVSAFGSYNATYGSLGALFGFMTWLWNCATIVIAGAELNAEAEHQTAEDTTTGPPRPMGERGAVMADTLGEPHHT
jgi:membrane protein